KGVACRQVVQFAEMGLAKREQFISPFDRDVRHVVQVCEPPSGHLSDFIERAVSKQTQRLRVVDKTRLFTGVDLCDALPEIVFQARQDDDGVGYVVSESR